MTTTHPKDGERLQALLWRVQALQRCGVQIQRAQVDALKRVVDVLLHHPRQAQRVRSPADLPTDLGKL